MIFPGTGSVLAYTMDAALEHVPQGWRYMIAIGEIPLHFRNSTLLVPKVDASTAIP